MSRLTKRAENGAAVYATPSGEPVKWENNRNKVLRKLAEYEDLEEQGLLIKLPCKVRTEVFYICQKNTIALEKGKIYKAVVSGLYAFEKGVCVTIQIYDDYGCTELEEINNFGKTVFLTKEEAEKVLERLECAE